MKPALKEISRNPDRSFHNASSLIVCRWNIAVEISFCNFFSLRAFPMIGVTWLRSCNVDASKKIFMVIGIFVCNSELFIGGRSNK
jgi:hypothetical protein